MVDDCLRRAQIGDSARVCFEPNGFDRWGRVSWEPTRELTDNQFTFMIISRYLGIPIIGALANDKTSYGFSLNREEKYSSRYSATYILYPRDIRTVKIYKNQ